MNRREMLRMVAGGTCASAFGTAARDLFAAQGAARTSMGLVTYCVGLRQKARAEGSDQPDLADPQSFLEHCHRIGLGGIQTPLKNRDEAYTKQLRATAEQYGMFIEGIANLPRDASDVDRFDAEMRTARQAGVSVVRVTMMSGRRYEQFASLEEFREAEKRGLRSLQLAEPVAARHGIRLAVENHKDQRVPERLEVLKRISSESVGACVDTGNSFALLEDPIAVIEAYAPWAVSVHLKDQAVQEYADGFLFADIPLGEGFLDVKRMVDILGKAKPKIRFSLELITRDPLQVPCLTDKFWATFADVPAADLARTLRIVRAHSKRQLPQVSHLPIEEQVTQETDNIRKSISYARDVLGLRPWTD